MKVSKIIKGIINKCHSEKISSSSSLYQTLISKPCVFPVTSCEEPTQGKRIYFPFVCVPSQPNSLHLVKKSPLTNAGITEDITDNTGDKLHKQGSNFGHPLGKRSRKRDQPCIHSNSRLYLQIWQCHFTQFSLFKARILVLEITTTFNEELHNAT